METKEERFNTVIFFMFYLWYATLIFLYTFKTTLWAKSVFVHSEIFDCLEDPKTQKLRHVYKNKSQWAKKGRGRVLKSANLWFDLVKHVLFGRNYLCKDSKLKWK